MVRLLAIAALLGLSAPARAERHGAGGSLRMAVRAAAESDVADGADRVYGTTGVVDLRGMYGKRLAVVADLGFEVGAEVPGGFAYAVRLEPLGAALRFGGRGWIGVVGGVAGSGVIDRVPIALELPVTAFAAVDLGNWVRLSSRARIAWTPTTSRREGGSRSIDFADELDIEAGVAIGRRESRYRAVYSDSTYVGAFMREQVDQRIVGVSVAVAISGAGVF